jgi:hypothetical protein
LYTSNRFPQKFMWTQDWLRRFRSGKIISVELTGRNDAAIANRQSTTLGDADLKIATHDDDDNDFVVVYADSCPQQPRSPKNATPVETTSVKAQSRSDTQQMIQDCEEASISRASAHSMDLCGRGDYNHTFQDLRSASQAIKRDKTTRQKYYNFRYVKLGDLGALRCEAVGVFDDSSDTQTEGDQSILTKSEVYRQAQLPPRPPKYHRRHIDKIRGTVSQRVSDRREARKHDKAVMEGHLRDL